MYHFLQVGLAVVILMTQHKTRYVWCIHHYVLIVLCHFLLCNLMSLSACCTHAGEHVLVCV